MKIRRFGLLVLLGVCCSAILLVSAWHAINHARGYRPDATKASSFLTSYSPQKVIESFAVLSFGSSWRVGSTSGGGRQSVTNARDYSPVFVAWRTKQGSVALALKDELTTKLRQSGATVLQQSGEAQTGYRLVYKSGSTVGWASISPVAATGTIYRNKPLPVGMQDMTTTISISEMWFQNEASAERAQNFSLADVAQSRFAR